MPNPEQMEKLARERDRLRVPQASDPAPEEPPPAAWSDTVAQCRALSNTSPQGHFLKRLHGLPGASSFKTPT
jgi:hypothetical protein